MDQPTGVERRRAAQTPARSTTGAIARAVLIPVAGAMVLGLAVGAANLLAEGVVDSPVWVSVFHRLTPWALATVLVGLAHRGRPGLAALAGLTTQLGLVAGYYGCQMLLTGQPLASGSVVAYGLIAVVSGPVYGLAGAVQGDPRALPRRLSVAVVCAPCFADGFRVLTAMLAVQTHVVASLLVASGYVVVGGVLLAVLSRSRRDRRASLLLALLCAAVVVVGLDVVLA